jgi:parvulin-like peptidyl-prolyl isomerase
MQRYKIKTQDKIKPQDAQAAIRQGKVSYRNRLFLRAYSQDSSTQSIKTIKTQDAQVAKKRPPTGNPHSLCLLSIF